jgi:hypothetical protein
VNYTSDKVIAPSYKDSEVTASPLSVNILGSYKKISAIAEAVPTTPNTSPITLANIARLIKNVKR